MSGWEAVGGALGRLFGGGQARDEAVYRDQLGQNASLEQKLATANRERMKSMALDALLNDESIPLQQRNILAAELGSQFSGLQQGLLRQQERGFRNEAFTRADAAGYGVNAPLMGLTNGPAELNKALAGGTMRGNTYLPGADLTPTELGLAEMFADRARGNASNAAAGASAARAESSRAQANASNALADLRGRTVPRGTTPAPIDKPTTAPATPAPKALPKLRTQAQIDEAMRQANAAIQAGADPEAVKARLESMGVSVNFGGE